MYHGMYDMPLDMRINTLLVIGNQLLSCQLSPS
jgi:hypothetical protein